MSRDTFTPELHLRQPEFTYSACGPFTKHRERIQKYREIGDLKHIYKTQLDKACFDHGAVYSDSKDLAKITISSRILKEKAYKIAINTVDINEDLASIVYNCFGKKLGPGASANKEQNTFRKYLRQTLVFM